MPPNVLLIVLDTARADAFEPYGAPAGATPVVADLAARGTAFPRVIAPSNWTVPSHASLFAGLHPYAFGLQGGSRGGREAFGERMRGLFAVHRDRVLAEVFRRAGYDTRGVSANSHWIRGANGFDTGFDEFRTVTGDRVMNAADPATLDQWTDARVDDGAADAERILRGWIDGGPARPFLWFVNLMECHSPYLPPRPYNDLDEPDRRRAAEAALYYLASTTNTLRLFVGDVDLPDDVAATFRHLYARAIRAIDDWLGRVLEALDAARLLDDTIVAITSDHGENLGDGGRLGHMLGMDERLLRVPLVVTGPASLQPQPLTSLAALPRLLADATGVDGPWSTADLPPAGVAVAQNEGLRQSPEERERARGRGVPPAASDLVNRSSAAATDGRFKLVQEFGGENLFDLNADPMETTDVLAAHTQTAAALREHLDRAGHARAPAVHATPEADPVDVSAEEQAEIEARLEALGYL